MNLLNNKNNMTSKTKIATGIKIWKNIATK